jgi:site-specific DNA recombinase
VFEAKIGSMSEETGDMAPILDKAIENLAKLDSLWIEATTIKKRQIIGPIFPEKLVFDGENFRTTRINEPVGLIYRLDAAFRENKNGTSLDFSNLSHEVIPLGRLGRFQTIFLFLSLSDKSLVFNIL